jgi:hypothetical protein
MATRKDLLSNLREEISKIDRRLGRQSLARCRKGAQRDFLARDFIKRFKGVTADEFDDMLEDWMTGDRPDPLSVQTVVQVMIETGNTRSVDVILDSIEVRIGGGAPSTNRGESESDRSIREAWWGDCVLEPFENAFQTTPRLRRRIKYLMDEVRKQSLPHTEVRGR